MQSCYNCNYRHYYAAQETCRVHKHRIAVRIDSGKDCETFYPRSCAMCTWHRNENGYFCNGQSANDCPYYLEKGFIL